MSAHLSPEAVLPEEASLADMESVEAALQMAPETKLAYGWINRRLKLRRQRDDLGLSRDAIRAAYRLDDDLQLDRELAELALAEDYLSGFLGQPGRYSLVADAELLFRGLAERLHALPDDLRRLWRLAGFAMIKGRAAVQGPMERYFPFAAPVPEHLPWLAVTGLAEAWGLPVAAEGAAEPPVTLEALAAAFADPARSDVLAPELFSLLERLRVEFEAHASPQRAITLLAKLRYTLARLAPERLSESQRLQVRSEAAAIQAQLAVLLGEPPSAVRPEKGFGARLGALFGGR